jgi:alginate O-acetyltransferase complex protein AlgJ
MKKIVLTLAGSIVAIILVVIVALLILMNSKEKAIASNPKSTTTLVVESAYELLYRVGISSSPKEVIVGKDGWLYSNQISRQTIVVDQERFKDSYTADAKNINLTLEEWRQYLISRGVKQFNVLVIPDKRSIYPEFLPSWATVDSRKPIEALIDLSDSKIVIDSFTALTQAKTSSKQSVFYKTDSQLTPTGAIAAFQFFSQEVGKEAPEIRWPSQSDYRLLSEATKYQGGLSKKIYSPSGAVETVEKIEFNNALIYSDIRKFDGNELLASGPINTLAIPNTSNGPILITTKGALNKKKVLWIENSIDLEMTPLMTMTFSQVLRIKWSSDLISSQRFLSIIEEWHPELIFFTLNQDNAVNPALAGRPENFMFLKPKALSSNYIGGVSYINDLSIMQSGRYRITGGDPYIIFNLQRPLDVKDMPLLNMNIACLDNKNIYSLPIQFFWQEHGKNFSQENSVRFNSKLKLQTVDLNYFRSWSKAKLIDKVRLDIDGNECKEFLLKNVGIGR